LPLVTEERLAPGWEPSAATEPDQGDRQDDRSAARVDSVLRRLPEHYRRVLELRFLQRLSVAETARAMGVSHGNAKVLQYRALRKAALLEDGADG
jgi:RNA polymerase sigma-70 factor (ECF subfamily)